MTIATGNNKLFEPALVKEALKQSFIKLKPGTMLKNPVMFTVETGTIIMFAVTLYSFVSGDKTQGTTGYNFAVFIVLLFTLLFANFAEAIAEARGKAQAESLRKTREDTPAKKMINGKNAGSSLITIKKRR